MEKPLSLQESSKSPKTMKKFLHKRKTERKASEEEYVIRKSMSRTFANLFTGELTGDFFKSRYLEQFVLGIICCKNTWKIWSLVRLLNKLSPAALPADSDKRQSVSFSCCRTLHPTWFPFPSGAHLLWTHFSPLGF